VVRKNKIGDYYVDCSHCKQSDNSAYSSETIAIEEAEKSGYVVVGKFHFCPSCFSEMLDRWRVHNQGALNANVE